MWGLCLKGQPRSTRNEFPIRADIGNSRKHPIWRQSSVVKTKLTAKGAVLSPEKRDLETYRNQVLQHSLAMKARGDVHANK